MCVEYITRDNAKFLFNFIIEKKLSNILELGIAHGTATCYMAAALDELGKGSINAVDLKEVKNIFKPSAEEQLKGAKLNSYINLHRMDSGYTWFLHDEIKNSTINDKCQEKYDLCIIDGPKNWTIDGCAFFLVDKLLKKGGWIIFDDYLYSYDKSTNKTTDGITHRKLSVDEQKLPQIKEVFELLVKPHPNYNNFKVFSSGDWAMAQKTDSNKKNYTIEYTETYKDFLSRFFIKLRNLKNKMS